MRHFLLSEAYPCISQPYILAIIFVRVIKITFTSDIIPPALTEKICVGQIINILLYRIISDSTFALQLLLELRLFAMLVGFVREPTDEHNKSSTADRISSRFILLRSTISLMYTSENSVVR